jgi:hypothetical protein
MSIPTTKSSLLNEEELIVFNEDPISEDQNKSHIKSVEPEEVYKNAFRELETHTDHIFDLLTNVMEDSIQKQKIVRKEMYDKIKEKDEIIHAYQEGLRKAEYEATVASETIMKLQHEVQLLKVGRNQASEYRELLEKYKKQRSELAKGVEEKDIKINALYERINKLEGLISGQVSQKLEEDIKLTEEIDSFIDNNDILPVLTNEEETVEREQKGWESNETDVSELETQVLHNEVEDANQFEPVHNEGEQKAQGLLFSSRKGKIHTDAKIKMRFKKLFDQL